jgi:alpha-glucoside transport system substrate-binding protein
MTLRRTTLLVVGLVVGLVAAAGCTGGATDAPTVGPSTAVAGEQVDVVGLWSGPERDAFATVTSAWEQDTGAVVSWQGSQDVARDLATRIDAGDPPDVAVLPNPGLLRELAAQGALVPLDEVLDADQVARDYPPAWLDLGTVDGELYGVVVKATSKATIWYAPQVLDATGGTVPATWDDLLALADATVADGRTPFSLVAPRGPGSGWALTDVVAQLVLGACGPDVYDRWVAAEIPWTDPCVRDAFVRFLALARTPGYVLGGVDGILTTSDAEGVVPVYTDPQAASLYPMASFAEGFVTAAFPDLEPGVGYGFFPFPPVDPALAGATTFGGDLVVVLDDTPAARSFVTFLVGAPAQGAWVGLGGYTSVNRQVPPDAYGDPVSRALAEDLMGADVVRFGAGDLMPAAVQPAWWEGMRALVQDPSVLDALLAALTATAAAAR